MTGTKQIITIFGATGTQGGSVARSLLDNPNFEVRCITRDPMSTKSKELTALGATVVKADGFNTHELLSAFSGSWAAFVNTNSEASDLTESGRNDLELGGNIVRSAAAAGVKHLIYSSAPPVYEVSNGAYSIPGLDMKSNVEKIARSTPGFETVTPIIAAWFMENFCDPQYADMLGGFPLREDNDGYLTYTTPLWGGKEDVPWISVTDDFGDLVHGILLNPMRWNGRLVQGVGDIQPFSEIVNAFIKVTEKKARYVPQPQLMEMETHGIDFLVQLRDIFSFTQLRGGEYYCNGPTEMRTSAYLKKEAFKAKGGKGREMLLSVEDWFQREFLRI